MFASRNAIGKTALTVLTNRFILGIIAHEIDTMISIYIVVLPPAFAQRIRQ